MCHSVAEIRRELTTRVGQLLTVCDDLGYELASAGTHPFAEWSEQQVTPKDRYQMLVDRCQWPARRLMIFESLPTAGIPYRLLSWAEFQRLMTTLVNSKTIETIREIWWDIRPHPDFGTVEVRMCDGMPTLDEVVSMTALIQSLVVWLGDRYDEGTLPPLPRYWIVRENKWRAARWSTEAEIIVDEDGNLESLSDSIERLVAEVAPVSRRLGCADELAGIRGILARGPSHVRQRRVYGETQDFKKVMESLVREFRESIT